MSYWYFELVTGVLDGVITRDQALLVACERGGTEAGVREMLNWARMIMQDEADPARRNHGSARMRRGRR